MTAVATAFVSAAGDVRRRGGLTARVTKRDLSSVGRDPVHGPDRDHDRVGRQLFLNSDALSWVISLAGVALFTALTAYDVQKITRGDYAAMHGHPRSARRSSRRSTCT